MSISSTEFLLSIITPEGKLFESKAIQANIPGLDGRFGVLEGHMNLISAIKPGLVEIFQSDTKETKLIAVFDGIAEVTQSTCSVLVEKGAHPKDMDEKDIRTLIESETKILEQADTEVLKHSCVKNINYLESLLEAKSK